MGSTKFYITLMEFEKSKTNERLTSYHWYETPNVGEHILLGNGDVFLIRKKILPSNDSNNVLLLGDVEKI